jgi:MYXO-CTERM domain-containing protein
MTLLSNRTKWMLLTALACLFAAGTASAQSNPANCTNDKDCVATPQCGGDICDWTDINNHVCRPAGVGAKGSDGWCTVDSDCKCMGQGAVCSGVYCTFTRACDAPGAGPCSATGGSGGTGTAGTSGGSGSGGGGCSICATAPTSASALLVALGLLVVSRRRRR